MPKSNGYIQWKGTDVCMDINCECGEQSHLDAEFAYAVQCPHCNKVYECVPTVELKPVESTKFTPIVAEK